MRYAVIMAGGSGTRLWPLSRKGRPKQLLELFDGKSLLRLAFERLQGILPAAQILVCTGRDYAADVLAQIPELPEENLLGEPVGRDSLNAVAWSTAVLAARDPQAVVAMVTADQQISPLGEFHAALERAFAAAEQRADALVTLGVVPTSPHTGYGYLQRAEEALEGVWRIAEFKEKPSRDVAEQYLASGQYWWNAGMFVWRAETFLAQLAALKPQTAEQVRALAEHPDRLDAIFPTLEKTSVDYSIMEPAATGSTGASVLSVPLAVEWKDVGDYESYAELLEPDVHGNRIVGPSVTLESNGCVVINTRPDHLVSTLGLSDMLVVATPQTTLVVPLSDAQRVKQVVEVVATQAGEEYV